MKTEPAARARRCSITLRRYHLAFCARTFLLLLCVFSLLVGGVAIRLRDKRKEARLVRTILTAGGTVCYDYEWTPGMSYADYAAQPHGPRWLRSLLGDKFFSSIALVQMRDAKRSSKNNSHFSPAATYHGYERICVKTRSCFWTTAKDDDLLEIGQLRSLRSLDLSHSASFTSLGLARIGRLTNLQELYLWDTTTDEQGLAVLGGLRNLEALVLDGTKTTDQALDHLQNLRHLSYLSLAGTRVTDAGVPKLKRLGSLRDLSLADNSLTDASVVYLRCMRNLATLNLSGNTRIAASAIDRLKAELPSTEITW